MSVSDYRKAGTYYYDIVAYAGLLSNFTTVKIIIQIDCLLTTINPVGVSNYTLGWKDEALKIYFPSFTDTLNCNPEITYTAVEYG